MVRASDILKQLILTAIQAADLQRRRLLELSARDFSVKHSKNFIDALMDFNKEILEILRKKLVLFEQLSEKEDYENLHNYIIQYLRLLEYLNYITHIVERSDRIYVGESTVILLSEFTKKFSDARFFVMPTYEYNYIYQNLQSFLDLVSKMLPNSKGIIKKLPDRLAVISFPDIYKDNLIANSELAHEVGHFINDLDGVTKKISKKVKINQNKLSEDLKKYNTTKLDYLLLQKIKATRINQINKIIRRWIMELASDLIALRLCGPAFVLALSELLLTKQTAEDATPDYPPATLRLKLLLEEIESIKFVDKIPNKENKEIVIDLISKINDHINSVPQKTGEPLVNEAIDSIIDLIKQESDKATQGFQYEPERFGNEVFELVEKLKQYVPPCEIKRGQPANPISILNAGMIFRLTWKNYPPPITITSQEDESEIVNIINSLVTKSIELSMIQGKMQENQK